MSQLTDHLTKESVERLYDKFVDGLDYLQGLNRQTLGFNKKSFNEVGEPLLRWFHHKLMETAKFDPNAPNPRFPFRAKRSMSDVIREETGITEHGKYAGMVGDSTRLLKVADLAFVYNQHIWLRPWDSDVKLSYIPSSLYVKLDEREEKRIEEEADKPVSSYVDLRKFKVPDSTPEAVMEFVSRFVPAAIKVQEDNAALRQKVLELTNQLAAVEEAAAEANTREQWKDITDKLGGLLSKQ